MITVDGRLEEEAWTEVGVYCPFLPIVSRCHGLRTLWTSGEELSSLRLSSEDVVPRLRTRAKIR